MFKISVKALIIIFFKANIINIMMTHCFFFLEVKEEFSDVIKETFGLLYPDDFFEFFTFINNQKGLFFVFFNFFYFKLF